MSQKTWRHNIVSGLRKAEGIFDQATGGDVYDLRGCYDSQGHMLMFAMQDMRFNLMVVMFLRNLVFYITENGYFGTAPDTTVHSVGVGDRIAIIAGLGLPVVLRPREDGSYVLISHCYCDGVMKGEMAEGDGSLFQDIELA